MTDWNSEILDSTDRFSICTRYNHNYGYLVRVDTSIVCTRYFLPLNFELSPPTEPRPGAGVEPMMSPSSETLLHLVHVILHILHCQSMRASDIDTKRHAFGIGVSSGAFKPAIETWYIHSHRRIHTPLNAVP